MPSPWPMVPLEHALRRRQEYVHIDDLTRYKRCRVQLHAQGVALRDVVSGSDIKTKEQQICRAGDFLVAEIDAKVGGYGIVPDHLHGAIVSGHYFLYQIDSRVLSRGYLDYFVRTPAFFDQVKARGTTNYAAIRPDDVLAYYVPLPPLSEQQRIVARIDALAAKIAEARGLREKAAEETKALSHSGTRGVFERLSKAMPTTRLAEVTTRITKGESPEWQGFTYTESGAVFIRSENVLWGTLDLASAVRIPPEFHRKLRRSRLVPGDVLINLVGASIGRCSSVPVGMGEANVNQAVAVLSPKCDLLDSEYLMHFLLSAQTQEVIHGVKVETARPNISLADLANLQISVPTVSMQRRIVAYLDGLQATVDALKRLQEETAAELTALLPAVLERAFKGDL